MSPTLIGIAVVEHQDRFLVGVRGDDGPLPGLAEFPGGKCKSDESPRNCAIRECLEETGLSVQPVRLLQNRQFDYPHGSVDLHFWLCRPVDAEQIADSHHSFRWVDQQTLTAMNFPEANDAVIEMLCDEADV